MLQFGSERGKDKKKQERDRLNEGSITLTGEQISPSMCVCVDAASNITIQGMVSNGTSHESTNLHQKDKD